MAGNETQDAQFERLRERARELPDRPGVYLHRNATGDVIYVGKARSLRNRVGSYFSAIGSHELKTWALVHDIDSIDVVVTNNELEAFLLENNLIKQHQPRYNVLLRDDKTYPWLKVTLSEDYPRVVFTRKVDRSRGDLYFGPFFAGSARRILKLITDQFQIRSCDLRINEGTSALPRPCLYYDMHRCPGPCVTGLTSREAYRTVVDDVVLFLGGKDRDLRKSLREKMYVASEEQRFEVATHYRDLLRTTERIQAEQQVVGSGSDKIDVWGYFEDGNDVAIQLFIMRGGNLVDRREMFWEKAENAEGRYFVAEVIQRFYEGNLFIPAEILIPFPIDDQELIAEWLSAQRGHKVIVRVAQRGRGAELADLAARNARVAHESRFRKSQQARLGDAATRLGIVLGHAGPVERIESFDISNIQGTDSVAGMVVFDAGRFDRKQYRVFNIKTVVGADDFRSMSEAVERRYRRQRDEQKPLPDLILIDGGRGQLNAAMSALAKVGIEGPTVAGLAKREEEVYLPSVDEPLKLERRDSALQLLQMIRDETHRYAVSSHRRRRSRRTLISELDELRGVGLKRRRLMLEHFGSVAGVKQASSQDLARLLGRTIGKSVFEQLHDQSPG